MRKAEFVAAVLGCILVLIALTIIWVLRYNAHRDLYVSGLGAIGEPTEKMFEAALLLVVIGGSAIAWVGREVHSTAPVLRAWTPSISMWIACGLFFVVSQVPCTVGCPTPYGDTFTWQDISHTVAAVLAFAAACWAMLQASWAEGHRVLAILSRTSAVAVGVIAATGGLFSIFQFHVVLGARFEFTSATIAIGWLVIFGGVLAARALQDIRAKPAQEHSASQETEQPVG